MDTVQNKNEEVLEEFMEINSFVLLNGRTVSGNHGQYTNITTNGKSVIDMMWCDHIHINSIVDLKVKHVVSGSKYSPIESTVFIFPFISNTLNITTTLNISNHGTLWSNEIILKI